MAKTKAEKITSIEEEIRQLENRRKRLSPSLFGNSTLSGCPSTWNPAEKAIKTMQPQSGAGRILTKRKKNRLPHHVRVLWDEAVNTGQVPNLEKLVAVIRSREVSLTLSYQ